MYVVVTKIEIHDVAMMKLCTLQRSDLISVVFNIKGQIRGTCVSHYHSYIKNTKKNLFTLDTLVLLHNCPPLSRIV